MEVDFSGSMAIKFYGVGVILDMVFRSSEMDCLQMNSHQVGVLQIRFPVVMLESGPDSDI